MASAKLRHATEESLDDAKVDMSPMIDMVFLLLIFFMINAVIIDYRKDKDVKIPMAVSAQAPEDIVGRVVINIFDDEVTDKRQTRYADELGKPLDEEGITTLVTQRKEQNEAIGVKTKLHIRGDREVDVEYTKRAVKAAAEAGVIDVIFSTYKQVTF